MLSRQRVLAAAVVLVAPLAASAAVVPPPSGGGTGHVVGPPGLCGAPSLAQCQTPTYYHSTCGVKNHEACNKILQDEYKAEYAAATAACPPSSSSGGILVNPGNTDGLTPLPVPAPCGGGSYDMIMPDSMKNGGQLLTGAIFPFDQTSAKGTGITTEDTFAVRMQLARDPSLFARFEFERITPLLTSIHPTWDGYSGDESYRLGHGKCDEYAYKKHYDYSRFEDAIASCMHDYICMYDVAANTANPGIGMVTMHSLDLHHTATDVQLPKSAVDQPKNTFFGLNPSYDSFGRLDRPAVDYAQLSYWVQRISKGTEGTDIMTAGATAPRWVRPDRWGWHQEMHASQEPYDMTLPEYADIARRTDAIRDAYERLRVSMQGLLLAPGGESTVDKILHPNKYTSCGTVRLVGSDNPDVPGPGSLGPPSLGGGGGTTTPSPTCSAKPFNPFVFYLDSESTAASLLDAVQDVAKLLVAEWRHTSVTSGAVDHGCLDVGGTRCDWTPKLIFDEYVNLPQFQQAREHDYEACVRATANNLTSSAPPYVYTDSRLATKSTIDGKADVYAFESWMDFAGYIRGVEAKDLHWAAAPNTLGDEHAGSRGLGSHDTLGADYAYNAYWRMPFARVDLKDGVQFCNKGVDIGGHLDANAYAFNFPINIMTADLRLHAGPDVGLHPTIDADVSFNKIFAKAIALGSSFKGLSSGDGGFHLGALPDPADFGDSVLVLIGGLPVTLSYGVEIQAGLGFDAEGVTNDWSCQDASATPPHFQVIGKVNPNVAAVAKVSGAIGGDFLGIGAEAGIEGDVTIVRAGVPISAEVDMEDAITVSSQGVKTPAVTISTSSSLALSVLDGDVKAFAELCILGGCLRSEKQIYHWNGISYSHDLYKPLDKSFGLMTILTATKPSDPDTSSPTP